MKLINVSGIEGYYYIEDGYLCYHCDDLVDIDVFDLSDLTISQYNDLADQLNNHYPGYNINKLNGRFI